MKITLPTYAYKNEHPAGQEGAEKPDLPHRLSMDDRTLSAQEADGELSKIKAALTEEIDAEIRWQGLIFRQ